MNELEELNAAYLAALQELKRLADENQKLKERVSNLKNRTSYYEDSYTRDFSRDRHGMGG